MSTFARSIHVVGATERLAELLPAARQLSPPPGLGAQPPGAHKIVVWPRAGSGVVSIYGSAFCGTQPSLFRLNDQYYDAVAEWSLMFGDHVFAVDVADVYGVRVRCWMARGSVQEVLGSIEMRKRPDFLRFRSWPGVRLAGVDELEEVWGRADTGTALAALAGCLGLPAEALSDRAAEWFRLDPDGPRRPEAIIVDV